LGGAQKQEDAKKQQPSELDLLVPVFTLETPELGASREAERREDTVAMDTDNQITSNLLGHSALLQGSEAVREFQESTIENTDPQVNETVAEGRALGPAVQQPEVKREPTPAEKQADAEVGNMDEQSKVLQGVVPKPTEEKPKAEQPQAVQEPTSEQQKVQEAAKKEQTKQSLREWQDTSSELRNRGTGEEWKKVTAQLHRDIAEAKKRFEKGERIADKELENLGKRMEYLEKATKSIDGKPPKIRKEAGAIYTRGLDALAKGKTEEAQIQDVLAKQYLTDRKQRVKIEEWSKRTAAGEQAAVTAEVGGYLAKKIESSAIKDEKINESLAKVIKPLLAKPTIKDLQRAQETKDAIKEHKKARRRLGKNKKAIAGLDKIYGRIISGMAQDRPKGYVAAQKQLAEMYTRPKRYILPTKKMNAAITAKREEVSKLSERLEPHAEKLDFKPESETVQASAQVSVKGGKPKEQQAEAAPVVSPEQKLEKEFTAYVSISNFIRGSKTQQRKEARQGRAAAEQMRETINGPLVGILGKLANGEPLSKQEQHAIAMKDLLTSDPSGLVKIFSTSQDEAFWHGTVFEGVEPAQQVLARLKGKNREKVAEMYKKAAENYYLGDHGKASTLMLAAQSYANAPSKETKQKILKLTEQLEQGKGRADVIQWELRTIFESDRLSPQIKDKTQRSKMQDYYDMSATAYKNGDVLGAKTLKDLGDKYGRAAAINDDSKAVTAVLELADGKEGLPSLEELKANYAGENKTFGELVGWKAEEIAVRSQIISNLADLNVLFAKPNSSLFACLKPLSNFRCIDALSYAGSPLSKSLSALSVAFLSTTPSFFLSFN